MKRSLITIALTLGCVAPAMADMALAKTRSCMACHAVEKKLVGPSFKDIAKRYAGQSDVAPQLASKIVKGGQCPCLPTTRSAKRNRTSWPNGC